MIINKFFNSLGLIYPFKIYLIVSIAEIIDNSNSSGFY